MCNRTMMCNRNALIVMRRSSYVKKGKSARSAGRTIRKNAAKGAAAEKRVARRYRKTGHKVVRTGIGHDFKVTKRGSSDGKFVEVKSGGAKLSKRQRAAKRKHGRRYVVERA